MNVIARLDFEIAYFEVAVPHFDHYAMWLPPFFFGFEEKLTFYLLKIDWVYLFMIWFGLVLWHINLCRLFNAKSIFM